MFLFPDSHVLPRLLWTELCEYLDLAEGITLKSQDSTVYSCRRRRDKWMFWGPGASLKLLLRVQHPCSSCFSGWRGRQGCDTLHYTVDTTDTLAATKYTVLAVAGLRAAAAGSSW